jgi:hypothetical protein
MKKDDKNMKMNTTDILHKLDNLADQVCLDNDNVVRWCIDQNDHDDVPDRTARGILQQNGLKVSDLKTLLNDGVLVCRLTDDIPGGMVDDRCLHVTTHLVPVLRVLPNILDRVW